MVLENSYFQCVLQVVHITPIKAINIHLNSFCSKYVNFSRKQKNLLWIFFFISVIWNLFHLFLNSRAAFEFLGQMTVTLPSVIRKKARMVTNGLLKGNLNADAKLTAQKPTKNITEHLVLVLFSRNDGTEKELAVVR